MGAGEKHALQQRSIYRLAPAMGTREMAFYFVGRHQTVRNTTKNTYRRNEHVSCVKK